MAPGQSGGTPRLAELIAALSLATDLGLGMPMEHVMRTCLISLRLGEHLGLTVEEQTELYYLAMLAWVSATTSRSGRMPPRRIRPGLTSCGSCFATSVRVPRCRAGCA
jgi:hypothetical protein